MLKRIKPLGGETVAIRRQELFKQVKRTDLEWATIGAS